MITPLPPFTLPANHTRVKVKTIMHLFNFQVERNNPIARRLSDEDKMVGGEIRSKGSISQVRALMFSDARNSYNNYATEPMARACE